MIYSAGMDHGHYDYAPVPERTVLRWPGNKPLAVTVFLYLEHWHTYAAADAVRDPRFNDPTGRYEPDYRTFSLRLYGLRIGIFRVLAALDRAPFKVTVAANAEAIEHYPYLMEQFAHRGYEIAAHGLNASQMISSRMTEAEERDYIARSRDAVTRATGSPPQGWVSQDYGESTRTPQLVAEAGMTYLADWANDDQPYRLKTTPPIMSVPNQADLDDVGLMWHRRVETRRYRQIVGDAAAQLALEGAQSGRFLGIHLHPWLVGMPHRIKAVEGMLTDLAARDDVWFASAAEVASHAREAALL